MKHILTRTIKSVILLGIIFIIAIGSALGGFFIGTQKSALSELVPATIRNASNSPAFSGGEEVDFSVFWQAWNAVQEYYFGEVDNQERLNGAIAGMVAELDDPYSMYFPPTENEIFAEDLEGSFGGVGAELTQKNQMITVMSVLDDSPAEEAGVQADDVIVAVDGESVEKYSFNEVITKIRGEAGTVVSLQILREGSEGPLDIKVTRRKIEIENIITKKLGDISYIKLNRFSAEVSAILRQELQLAEQESAGIVLDLRNNPGGYLVSSIEISGMFLPSNPESENKQLEKRLVVMEKDKKGSEKPHYASTDPVVPTKPVVVLINKGSASASEIVAGALQDYGRATIVGETSFGKGSVQEIYELKNKGSVKLTVAKWFTPLGTGIDGTGIVPDIEVALKEDEDSSDNDTQVKKALEILNKN